MKLTKEEAKCEMEEKLLGYHVSNEVIVVNYISYQLRVLPYLSSESGNCLLPSHIIDGLSRVLRADLENMLGLSIDPINDGIKTEEGLAEFFNCLGDVDILSRRCNEEERNRLVSICRNHFTNNPYRIEKVGRVQIEKENEEIYYASISLK